MQTLKLEDLMLFCILVFCENAAELGCPANTDVDMWFRELSYADAFKVTEKMLDIIDKDYYNNKKDKSKKNVKSKRRNKSKISR